MEPDDNEELVNQTETELPSETIGEPTSKEPGATDEIKGEPELTDEPTDTETESGGEHDTGEAGTDMTENGDFTPTSYHSAETESTAAHITGNDLNVEQHIRRFGDPYIPVTVAAKNQNTKRGARQFGEPLYSNTGEAISNNQEVTI